jgi:hypothetical protein
LTGQRSPGNPEHAAITVHFLNAVLADTRRIENVEILDPNCNR